MQVISNDNNGNKVPAHPNMADPIAASGQTLTNATADADGTATVVAGATYVFTTLKTGGFYFSITGVVTTPANIEWACPLQQSVIIKIPVGVTTLHYATDTNNGKGFLRRIE
jgi:hypothetical protein